MTTKKIISVSVLFTDKKAPVYFNGIDLSISIEGNFLKIWDNGTGEQKVILSACSLNYITCSYSEE